MKLQDYSPKPQIEGVRLIDLDWHYDDGGDFCEILRLISGCGEEVGGLYESFPYKISSGFKFEQLQVSWTFLQPGVVKGFHLHREQTDYAFLKPHQRILVGLLDLREFDSNGVHKDGGLLSNKIWDREVLTMRLTVGLKPQLLIIPPGVAHGYKNLDNRPADLVYITDRLFNPKDEFRLPYDILGDRLLVEKFWEIQNG